MLVVEIKGDEALVELGGVTKMVSITLLESVAPGDYVLVHAGFAIGVVDEEEARLSLEAYEACSEDPEEEGPGAR
jgi:hydrogenase assembly chaperone HypC/HupF